MVAATTGSLMRPYIYGHRVQSVKQAYTCFIARTRRLKLLDQDFPHINRLVRASQDLYSGENCFLDRSWHLNRLVRASQDLHSGENCFLDRSWHLNRPTRASKHLLGGSNGSFPHINRLVRASHDLHSADFLHRPWKLKTCFTVPPRG